MRQKSGTTDSPSERIVKTIHRATRKQYSAEEKIRIVLDGLRCPSSDNSSPKPARSMATGD
jgi:transposase